MELETLNKIVAIRNALINEHGRKRDYRNNKNALMKEIDHVAFIEKVIKQIDALLSEQRNVNFS